MATQQWNQALAELDRCPYCGSGGWHDSAFDAEATGYLISCDECQNRWWDAYKFVGFQPYRDTGNWNGGFADKEDCPYCGSGEWEREVFDGKMGFPAQCLDCGRRWWERYERTGFEPYPEEEGGWRQISAYCQTPAVLRWLIKMLFRIRVAITRGSDERGGAMAALRTDETFEHALRRLESVRRQAEVYRLCLLRQATSRRQVEEIVATPWQDLDDYREEANVLATILQAGDQDDRNVRLLALTMERLSVLVQGVLDEQGEILEQWEVAPVRDCNTTVNWLKEGF